MRRAYLTLLLVFLSCGCTRVCVHKNPSPDDAGIRYYRPKPYLFISPGSGGGGGGPAFTVSQNKPLEIKTAATQPASFTRLASQSQPAPGSRIEVPMPAEGSEKTGKPAQSDVPKEISIQLVYMPDFAEEYSIELKPGLGIGELNVKLDNGWNLTSVGIKTDQQTDEIIKSVAELAEASKGLFGSRESASTTGCIYATNVPFGFYEAVIAEDPCGRKQLYGWRYIGFMPFQACPTSPGGMQYMTCECDYNSIFGLVWLDGILQFQRIGEIPQLPIDR